MTRVLRAGEPSPMGATWDGEGINFAVYSAHAEKIELCLFTPDGREETARLTLPERSGPVWHGYLEGAGPGTVYGYRAHGPYEPTLGHRFNPNKLLLDPYARELVGHWAYNTVLLGYDPEAAEADLSFDRRDSAPYVAKGVVPIPDLPVEQINGPRRARSDALIYEAHVKGLTREHPLVEPELRGTYEGLVADAMIEHFLRLGVTAVELLPVQSFLDDAFLLRRGLRNYWGYNTIGFFAPEPRYLGPSGRAGFRDMVERLHEVGIEVILDVVYNHTAETDHLGPTLSFRGLDNASYYRLMPGQARYYANDTGTGNALNLSNPYVMRMVLDSLRYWVEVMGVDGFRFDLATTLGREEQGFDPGAGFLDALRQDPVLSRARLIAEPWDIGPGGYQLGRFPPEFSEWNDQYRDGVRRFWRGDAQSTQDLAARLLGSADHFDHDGRPAWSSINFVTAHDGFTLADVTRYTTRHNLANGEDNRDGHHSNFSANFGVEGASGDPDVQRRRKRRQINLMATLLLSQGVPMMLAGDEIGNSQHGNNNAYCQDNPLGWINWDKADLDLLEALRGLTALRRRYAALRQSRFLHGSIRAQDGARDVEWRELDGGPVDWRDPHLGAICLMLRGSADVVDPSCETLALVFNGRDGDLPLRLPQAAQGMMWHQVLDTASDDLFAQVPYDRVTAVSRGQSVMVFALEPDPA